MAFAPILTEDVSRHTRHGIPYLFAREHQERVLCNVRVNQKKNDNTRCQEFVPNVRRPSSLQAPTFLNEEIHAEEDQLNRPLDPRRAKLLNQPKRPWQSMEGTGTPLISGRTRKFHVSWMSRSRPKNNPVGHFERGRSGF